MIILYSKDEKEFNTLGIGVLTDAISCVVTEELNGIFELEMEYPITGVYYSDILEDRIILAKANDILQDQPFRIYKITKPIDGTVTVYGEHISYDMSKIPIRALKAESLEELLTAIPTKTMIHSDFVITKGPDKPEENKTSYVTYKPYNLRSLLIGKDESILNVYSGEFLFDRYNVILYDRRGKDRDFVVRYSKNMTDIEVETSAEVMFNGVCPFYSNTTTSTKTGLGKKYKEIYLSNEASTIVPVKDPETGQDLYPSNWLSYNINGVGIKLILTLSVTNIISTEGEFYNHLVRAKEVLLPDATEKEAFYYDVTYTMAYINRYAINEFGPEWLFADDAMTEYIIPVANTPYRIFTPGDKQYKIYLWDDVEGKYRPLDKDDNIEEYPPNLPTTVTTNEEKNVTIVYEGEIIYLNEVRCDINENAVEKSADWLYEVEELNQYVASDPRWKRVGENPQPIVPEENVNYKVIHLETYITAYPIEGVKTGDPGWLTIEEGSDIPLDPIDGQGYKVIREDEKEFYYRWSLDENKYVQMRDTRYTYTNYVWDSTLGEYVDRDTSNDKILTLDLSDNFTDEPKDGSIFNKKIYDDSIKFMTDNKFGELRESVKVSFFKLSNSPEYSKWKELEKVDLGDTVHILYEDMNVDTTKKVIKIEYNSLTESYDSIELGELTSDFTSDAIVSGDSISALTNDRKYADITTVTSLVADKITAEYIKGVTAEITQAQIDTLTSDSIVTNVITASSFEIDNLVSKLLIADDAAIKNQLTAGSVIVNGEMNIHAGSITMTSSDEIADSIKAYINPNATTEYDTTWLIANIGDSHPIDISQDMDPDTGESIHVYNVYDEYEVRQGYFKYYASPTYAYKEYRPKESTIFQVDGDGKVYANDVEVSGKITATSGDIGGCTIEGIPSEYTKAYIIEDSIPFTSGWLTLEEGSFIPLIPDDGDIYQVYYNMDTIYVEWREILDMYIDMEVGVLKVGKANIDEISADQVIGGAIQASSIELGEYVPTAIIGYTLENVSDFSYNWLTSKEDGTEAFEPSANVIYNVIRRTSRTAGGETYYTYEDIGYYKFNSAANVYEYYTPTNNESSPKCNITDDGIININSGKLNIGSGNFEVDEAGNLTCKSVTITSGNMTEIDILQAYDANLNNVEATGDIKLNGNITIQDIGIYADNSESGTYVTANFFIDNTKVKIKNIIRRLNPTPIYGHRIFIPFNINPTSVHNVGTYELSYITNMHFHLRCRHYSSNEWYPIESTAFSDFRTLNMIYNCNVGATEDNTSYWIDIAFDEKDYEAVPGMTSKNTHEYEIDVIEGTPTITYDSIYINDNGMYRDEFIIRQNGIVKTEYKYLELQNVYINYDDEDVHPGYYLHSELGLVDSDYECSGILTNISVSATITIQGRNNVYTETINQSNITFNASVGFVELNKIYLDQQFPAQLIQKVVVHNINPPGYEIDLTTSTKNNLYIENGIITPKIGHEESYIDNAYIDYMNCNKLKVNSIPFNFGVYATTINVAANSTSSISFNSLLQDYDCGIDLTNRVVSVIATLSRTTNWTSGARARDGVAASVNSLGNAVVIVNNYDTTEDINVLIIYK